MYQNLQALQGSQHADLTLSHTADYAFAGAEIFVPISYSELSDISREYPLLFVKDQPLPVALTGLVPNKNAYLDENGRWLAHYIPAAVRAYPFKLATRVTEQGNSFVLMVDQDAKQLNSKTGTPLFDKQAQPTDALKARLDTLQKMKRQEMRTALMTKLLRDAGLLKAQTLSVRLPTGEVSRLAGIEIVDEKKLNQLDAETFVQLRDQGLLPLIYAHLLSLANLRHGVIAGKYPEFAMTTTAEESVPQSLDSIFGEGDDHDTFSF